MKHFDLIIIGAGSGNSILGPEHADLSVAFVQEGPFGGTCLNVGCIPTKMFVHAANLARTVTTASRLGINAELTSVDWPAIQQRIFNRIDPIAEAGEDYRRNHSDNAHVTVYGRGEFTGPKQLRVSTGGGSEEITGGHIVIAAGARPRMLDIPGMDTVTIHTSDTIMRISELPKRMLVIGGGVIAAEFAAMFAAFGVHVSVATIEDRMLEREDLEISRRFTNVASEYLDFYGESTVSSFTQETDGIRATLTTPEGQKDILVDTVLMAVGRVPNTDQLKVALAGIDVNHGQVVVDEYQRVLGGGKVLDGVWALGDICSPYQLKHVANKEAATVAHNIVSNDLRTTNHAAIPHGVFSFPEVAAVGLTEEQAREKYGDVVVGKQKYADIAYGWAMEDDTGFAKVIARKNGEILGAHIIGPQAPTLIQILVQAMATGQKVQEIARTQYWPHPAMGELVENALLQIVPE